MQSGPHYECLGNAGRQGCALAAPAFDAQGPAQQGRALANAEQSNRFRVMNFGLGNAAAVVLHFEHDLAVGFSQTHFHFCRVCVADDVGERLLKNAEERGVEFLVPTRFYHLRRHLAANSRLHLELVRLPFQRGQQSGGVKDAGAKLGGDAANGLNGFVNVGRH